MPQTINISKTNPTDNYITVGDDVVEITTDQITFVNNLNPQSDAIVTFYRNGKQKLADNPIKNFCDNGQDAFTVDAGDTAVCNVRGPINNREYLYTIQATDYVTLDPVMILDRPGGGSGEGFGLFALAFVGIAGLAVGFGAGRFSAKTGKAEPQT